MIKLTGQMKLNIWEYIYKIEPLVFSCCFNKTKTKFYRTVNEILGKTGKLDGVFWMG